MVLPMICSGLSSTASRERKATQRVMEKLTSRFTTPISSTINKLAVKEKKPMSPLTAA